MAGKHSLCIHRVCKMDTIAPAESEVVPGTLLLIGEKQR